MKLVTTIFVCCVCALLAVGIVMLYSSSSTEVGTKYLLQQLLGCLLGLTLCISLAFMDYRVIKKYVFWFLGLAVILLLLVYVPHIGLGKIKGAHRWIGHGSIRFQPSEFAKFALVIFLAWYCSENQRQMPGFRRGLVIPGTVIVLLVALVFKEPDRGCAILLAAVSGCMLVIAGVRLWYFIPPGLMALTWLGYSLWHDPMRAKRILAWLHPEENRLGAGWQAYQAMIALGSGGWTGLGLGNGRQKLGFVPEHHTDFIYSIIGEELGLVATLLVLVTFIVLVFCAMIISRRAKDSFGLLLGSGVTFLIGFQALINIGVVTSTFPNKGMPLPFISYGCSNLVMMFFGVGILLSISRFAIEPGKESEGSEGINSPELSDA